LSEYTKAQLSLLEYTGIKLNEIPRLRGLFYEIVQADRYKIANETKSFYFRTQEKKINFEIHTRTGGGNREAYLKDNARLMQGKGFIYDCDNSDDSTYASFYYEIPYNILIK
jgi:hypothetical protein